MSCEAAARVKPEVRLCEPWVTRAWIDDPWSGDTDPRESNEVCAGNFLSRTDGIGLLDLCLQFLCRRFAAR